MVDSDEMFDFICTGNALRHSRSDALGLSMAPAAPPAGMAVIGVYTYNGHSCRRIPCIPDRNAHERPLVTPGRRVLLRLPGGAAGAMDNGPSPDMPEMSLIHATRTTEAERQGNRIDLEVVDKLPNQANDSDSD